MKAPHTLLQKYISFAMSKAKNHIEGTIHKI
jgi:hypothetical protein